MENAAIGAALTPFPVVVRPWIANENLPGASLHVIIEVYPMAVDSHAYMIWPLGLSHMLHAGIGSICCKWGSMQKTTALWWFMHANWH